MKRHSGSIKRTIAMLMAMLILFTGGPFESVALAAGTQDSAAVCTCAAPCTAEAHSADCPVCAVDYTACAAVAQTPEAPAQAPAVPEAVAALLEQIAALAELTPEELNAAGEAVGAAIDAMDALSDDDLVYFEENHAAEQTALYALVTAITEAQGYAAQTTATTALTELWVGGTQVEDVNAAATGDGWSYDNTTNTLTLTGATITGKEAPDLTGLSDADREDMYYRYESGIFVDGDLNIVLSGYTTVGAYNATNHVFSALLDRENDRHSAAIYCPNGDLNISGPGSLNINNKVLDETSYKVTTSGAGGGGNEPKSIFGFYLYHGGITIGSDSSVSIKITQEVASEAQIPATGIVARDVFVNGGTLNVEVLNSTYGNTWYTRGINVSLLPLRRRL